VQTHRNSAESECVEQERADRRQEEDDEHGDAGCAHKFFPIRKLASSHDERLSRCDDKEVRPHGTECKHDRQRDGRGHEAERYDGDDADAIVNFEVREVFAYT